MKLCLFILSRNHQDVLLASNDMLRIKSSYKNNIGLILFRISPVIFNLCSFVFSLNYNFAKACSISALMSIMFSIPTEIRSNPGNTPADILSSGDSCSWVVAAG